LRDQRRNHGGVAIDGMRDAESPRYLARKGDRSLLRLALSRNATPIR
jgi:hypothetical protein